MGRSAAALLAGALIALCGCTSRIDSAKAPLSDLRSGHAPQVQTGGNLTIGEPLDLVAEEAAAKGCINAWRQALKGDSEGAMKALVELDRKYPRLITIKFMMGQVAEHGGKKAEAVKYYRQAVERSKFNSIYLFKLAESLRTSGDAKASLPHYRNLIGLNPDFAPGRLGLARALYALDRKSAEAREQVAQAIRLEPANKDARMLAKEMGSPN